MRQEMFAEAGGHQAASITVYDFAAGKLLTLTPASKLGTVRDLSSHMATDQRLNIVEHFKSLNKDSAQLAGQVEEDGKTVLIYDIDQPNLKMRVWADKATLLPVRMETRTTLPGQNTATVMLMDSIQWDADIDEAMFSMTPPAGYQLATDGLGKPGTEDLVRLLRLWTVLSDGRFPDQLHPMNMYQIGGVFGEFNKRIEADHIDGGIAYGTVARAIGMNVERINDQNTGEFQQRIQAVAGRGVTFIASHLGPGGWRWTGKGAKIGDADRIVCYWKSDEGTNYTALDANLELKQLTAAELPK
jgi:hypothetical protein